MLHSNSTANANQQENIQHPESLNVFGQECKLLGKQTLHCAIFANAEVCSRECRGSLFGDSSIGIASYWCHTDPFYTDLVIVASGKLILNVTACLTLQT